jgi:hypothetical protein
MWLISVNVYQTDLSKTTDTNITDRNNTNITHEESLPRTLKVFNSHDQLFSIHEPSTVVFHLALTDNYPRTSFSLSYKPLIWHRENASIVASLLKRLTSLLTRSRDPSPLLRQRSVYSCCLATNLARRCDATRCATRHGSARLGSARIKHRFVYYCVILGACFDVTVLAWRKYSTLHIPQKLQIIYVYNKSE